MITLSRALRGMMPASLLLLGACGSGGDSAPAASYAIGGTVTGLMGTVVLQNNGGDDLTINADSNFTFTTPVSSYDVTVRTQPNSQTCTVNNGSGTASAPVSDVTVTCAAKAWGTAALVETEPGEAVAHQIAFDADGNALAVWQYWNDTDGMYNIMASRYTAAAGWGAAVRIGDNLGDARNPQIAIAADGNALAVWTQSDGARNNIMASRYTAGTGWGSAALIETDDAGDAWDPQIAIDAAGNALAVWQHYDGRYGSIMCNRYTAATGWGTAAPVETADGHAYLPQLVVDSTGNALAVWHHSDGTRYNVMANRYTVGTGWGTAGQIETDNAGDAVSPQIAIGADGNAMAVWSQQDGTRDNIWANRYILGTGWGAAELIETDDAGGAQSPQVAIDADGNALAVWTQSDGTRYNIVANRYTAGTGWGAAALIETSDLGSTEGPQIAFDAYGNALAVWWQFDGALDHVWANRYTAGTGWGSAVLIETDDVGSARAPQLAIDADGNGLAVWTQYDGTTGNLMANRFE